MLAPKPILAIPVHDLEGHKQHLVVVEAIDRGYDRLGLVLQGKTNWVLNPWGRIVEVPATIEVTREWFVLNVKELAHG